MVNYWNIKRYATFYLLSVVLPFQKFYQPVGEVDVGGADFGGGVFFEEVADFKVEVWEVGCAAEPEILEQKAHCTLGLFWVSHPWKQPESWMAALDWSWRSTKMSLYWSIMRNQKGFAKQRWQRRANTPASCSKQAARATPKGSLRMLCAGDGHK